MNSKKFFRFLFCLSILNGIIVSPLFLFAEEAGKIIEYKSGSYYTIQKGDTLWDISDRFFDSPELWPYLWRENSQISNPHLIYPDERIRLFQYMGNKNIANINKDTYNNSLQGKEENNLHYYYYSPINSVGFIRKEPVIPAGAIFGVKDDKRIISTGDLVYIKKTVNTSIIPGRLFTVYRTLKPGSCKTKKADIGMQYYFVGVVEITKEEPDFALGRIVKSFRSIRVDDLLMPYKQRSPKIMLAESKKGIQGEIIASEENRNIFGDGNIAFIDKGADDGINIGQSYTVYDQKKKRICSESGKEIALTPVNFGKVLVLHTEKNTATVLITNSAKDIQPGDKICSPL